MKKTVNEEKVAEKGEKTGGGDEHLLKWAEYRDELGEYYVAKCGRRQFLVEVFWDETPTRYELTCLRKCKGAEIEDRYLPVTTTISRDCASLSECKQAAARMANKGEW